MLAPWRAASPSQPASHRPRPRRQDDDPKQQGTPCCFTGHGAPQVHNDDYDMLVADHSNEEIHHAVARHENNSNAKSHRASSDDCDCHSASASLDTHNNEEAAAVGFRLGQHQLQIQSIWMSSRPPSVRLDDDAFVGWTLDGTRRTAWAGGGGGPTRWPRGEREKRRWRPSRRVVVPKEPQPWRACCEGGGAPLRPPQRL